jgi:hypothetical protein
VYACVQPVKPRSENLAGNVGKPLLWVMQNVAFINGRAIIEGNGIIDIAADNDDEVGMDTLKQLMSDLEFRATYANATRFALDKLLGLKRID